MRALSLVPALGALAVAPLLAQEPPEPKPQLPATSPGATAQAPPVFGVGVDVVAVDASVVDRDGRPITGLSPDDFRVEVDGKPRRLVSVEYVGRELETPAPARARQDRPPHFSSNEGAPKGRLVLLLVDRGNIGRGGGRQVLKSAERFLDSLGPADRVGLAFIPGPGPGIEFTADLDEVRRGLKGVVGTANRAGHVVPLAEAIAKFEGTDAMRWQEFLVSQCGGFMREGPVVADSPDQGTPFAVAQLQACQRTMEVDATVVYRDYRERSLASQAALRTTFQSLRSIDGPKTVVLISEGLGTESPGEVRDLGVAASQAQATLFVVLLDTSSADASVAYSALASQEDREKESAGLYDLAAQARGTVLRAIGTGEAAFQRIARELMGFYLLGFEPEGGDRDGKGHAVRVTVSRPNTTVRARALLAIPLAPPSPEEALTTALRSPLPARELPVQVATYALSAAAGGKVRVLISARTRPTSRPVSIGYAVFSPAGKVAASRAYHGLAGGTDEWLEFTGEAVVDAAAYTLRLVAVDASGRRGSVEHGVKAALVDAGGLQVSDLVLSPASDGSAVRPAVDTEISSGGLSAFLEVGSGNAGRLAQAGVAIELAESADSPALLRVPVALPPPGEQGTRAARIEVAAGLLPPGEYTARAQVSIEGKEVGVVSRPFRIVPLRAGEKPPSAPLARLLVQAPPFDRAALLAPEVLGPLADEVVAAVRGPAPPGLSAAVEEARQGRPEAILDRLGAEGREDARVEFLRGVSYYARGNLPAALTQLQAAQRRSSELFPAAVYLGACYAAGGKDLDAIGAWQTALIGESASPALYGLLGDALLRAKEERQAVEILAEGLGAFPDDPGLRGRLGVAYAMAGDRDEALPILTAWVEKNPDDTRALFATLALLFEGFSREATGAAPLEERQRLVRFAKAYVEGKGPNSEVVGCWLKYLESRDADRSGPAARANDPGRS
jgi:VWFA-related protein